MADNDDGHSSRAWAALNRLAKWRMVFAGWQLGTRSKVDPEAAAVRDHREASLMMRVELRAMLSLLLDKDVFTFDQWLQQLEIEAQKLDEELARKFPGFTTTDVGISITAEGFEWMTAQGWKP